MTSHEESNTARARRRNSAEYPVLAVLLGGPLHGYDMHRRLTQAIGSTWRLGKSQIYALLARLEREGLVTHRRLGQNNLPAKNIFRLTTEGREVANEWLEQPVHRVRDMRLEFLTKLWFVRQTSPGRERHLIERQVRVCQRKVQDFERLQTTCESEVEVLFIDFRLALIRTTVSWLNALLDRNEAENARAREEGNQ